MMRFIGPVVFGLFVTFVAVPQDVVTDVGPELPPSSQAVNNQPASTLLVREIAFGLFASHDDEQVRAMNRAIHRGELRLATFSEIRGDTRNKSERDYIEYHPRPPTIVYETEFVREHPLCVVQSAFLWIALAYTFDRDHDIAFDPPAALQPREELFERELTNYLRVQYYATTGLYEYLATHACDQQIKRLPVSVRTWQAASASDRCGIIKRGTLFDGYHIRFAIIDQFPDLRERLAALSCEPP